MLLRIKTGYQVKRFALGAIDRETIFDATPIKRRTT